MVESTSALVVPRLVDSGASRLLLQQLHGFVDVHVCTAQSELGVLLLEAALNQDPELLGAADDLARSITQFVRLRPFVADVVVLRPGRLVLVPHRNSTWVFVPRRDTARAHVRRLVFPVWSVRIIPRITSTAGMQSAPCASCECI